MKLFLRLISILALLISFVLLIVDGASSIDGGQLFWTSTGDFLGRMGAGERFQALVTGKLGAGVWRGLKLTVLAAPVVLVAGVGGLIFWRLGRIATPDYVPRVRDDTA